MLAALSCVLSGAVAVVMLGLVWNALFAGMQVLPAKDALWTVNREPGVEFVDAQERTISVRGPHYGRAVSVDRLPPHVVNAFIAAEDGGFRIHSGLNLVATARAALRNVGAGHVVQGGSTITQQLVKNLLRDDDQTFIRKAQEAKLAIELETLLSKNEILDLYLNRIYFGDGAYGLGAAANIWFNKAPAALSLAEASLLAALPKAPSRFAKGKDGAALRNRQSYVLDQMVSGDFVSAAEAAVAKADPLVFSERAPVDGSSHALDYALAELRQVLPNAPADLVVKLSIDVDLQKATDDAMEQELGALKGGEQGAAVLMDRTGAIKAMFGGHDYAASKFNRATQAQRQPGSAFKVFVYAAALEAGFTPRSVRIDRPLEIGDWKPRNYKDEYKGSVSLTEALSQSINTVAVQIGQEIGPDKVAALARRFGVRSNLNNYPSIALGTDEVTLLEMTTGYGVLARNGLEMAPHIIDEVRNSKGHVLYSRPVASDRRVYPQQAAEAMTAMLRRVVIAGTGQQAQVKGQDVAGKTGTSQDWRDAWFFGYATQFVAGVWIGNDGDAAMDEVSGGQAPARIFSKVMARALAGAPRELLPHAPDNDLGIDVEGAAALVSVAAADDTVVASDETVILQHTAP